VIDMMRKLTATGLATLAVAGIAGTGAAFAASSHPGKPPVASVSADKSSSKDTARERASSDRASRERHSMDRSHETRSSDRAHHAESGR
jgi:hypothetical protein